MYLLFCVRDMFDCVRWHFTHAGGYFEFIGIAYFTEFGMMKLLHMKNVIKEGKYEGKH